ncbi:MAG: phosphatase PAP2 family protein, partial [Candidatus Methylomirabilales bacterium]
HEYDSVRCYICGRGERAVKRGDIRYRLWGGVAILNLVAYLWLALLVKANGPFPIDRAARAFFQASQDATLGWLIERWAVFGDWQLLTVFLLILSLFFSPQVRKEFILFFLLALGGGGALGQLSKVVVGRVRPGDPRLGFPSGHTLAALVVVSGLLYFTYRVGLFRRPLALACSAGAGSVIVVGVGVSRMYTDSHWLTDVFGGILLGVALATAVALVIHLKMAERSRDVKVGVHPQPSAMNPEP